METTAVPDGFPCESTPAVVAGAQPKVCARLSQGVYVSGPTEDERLERWLICEDLAKQLVPVALKDAKLHPWSSASETLGRVRLAVSRKAWVSPLELAWLMRRLQVLLGW